MSTESRINPLRKSIYTPVEFDFQIPFKAKKKIWFYLSCHFILIEVYHILYIGFQMPHPFSIRGAIPRNV